MLQYSCECDPNILSLFQPKVLKAIDYIGNINKQCPDVDAIYKHISRSETCNIDKPTAAKIIDAVIDQNVIENRRITSGQASYFHCHEGNNKNGYSFSRKTCDEGNLPVTTNNISNSI